MATVTKNSIASKAFQEKGVVVLPLRQYEKMKETIESLKEARRLAIEEAEVLRIIAEGEKEYKEGKLKPLRSFAALR